MARGVQMQQLMTDLRAEIGHSTSTALGVNMRDTLQQYLKRTQERLWEDHDWSYLRVKEKKQLQAGCYYYDIPTNLTLERIEKIHVRDGGKWKALTLGIDTDEYNQYDSDADVRLDPAMKWMPYGANQIEIWPIPNSNGDASTLENYIRITGIRNISPFVSDTDTAELDSLLIVLFSAAELLAKKKSEDADVKFQLATTRLKTLQGRLSTKRRFSLSGEPQGQSFERLTAVRL